MDQDTGGAPIRTSSSTRAADSRARRTGGERSSSGSAGVILVTGIAPVMVTSLGAASIPLIVVITIMGYLLCLMLAELSAMMPERTGGAPSYVYPAMRAQVAARGEARERPRLVDVLARLVPRGAAQHDPGVLLHRRPLRARHDVGLHADRHADRLVDADHLRRRDPAVLHPGLPRDPRRRPLRHRARRAGDDPADLPRRRLAVHGRRGLGPALRLPPARRHRASSPASTARAGSRSTWATRSC